MSIAPQREADHLRPLHVVMIFLVGIIVIGGSLLLSAAQSTALVDGAVEWQEESPLRAVVQLLCLRYRYPTLHAGEVKGFVLAVGAGLSMIVLGIGLAARPRTAAAGPAQDLPDDASVLAGATATTASSPSGLASPLRVAQVLIGLYLLWSFASARWSAAPHLAIGGSVLLSIQFLWAFGIGSGLSPLAARITSRIIAVAAAVTAVLAVWYFYGRNPVLRAKFPYGNPTFLAACLVPGMLLAVTLTLEKVSAVIRTRRSGSLVPAAVFLAVIGVCAWAFLLADSRGPAVGLVFGLLAVGLFALRGRWKLIPVIVAVAVVLAGWMYALALAGTPSPTGRDATLRTRRYAWSYAWKMFAEKPFQGHGQGGYVLAGDAHAIKDVLRDPQALGVRLAHAHSEWLEVAADLGIVGIVLLVAGLLLTLRAGVLALRARPRNEQRWALIGLMSALVGLMAEESVGVGLRVSGVPVLFYTVLGLLWALAGSHTVGFTSALSVTRGRRISAGIVGGVVGLLVLAVAQYDFGVARAAYRVEQLIVGGKYEEAARLAPASRSPLNPQRALTGLYRMAESHMLSARRLQERAVDRETRARATERADPHLLALARQDREASDAHCVEGSKTLKELVAQSPGFFNHGRVEYALNLVQAQNAAARNDPKEHELLLNARSVIERELRRQPFEPLLALEYVSIAGESLDLRGAMVALARPLRHHRLTPVYVEWLAHLAAEPDFAERFKPIVQQAQRACEAVPADEGDDTPEEIWAPEKLRIAATIDFRSGDYQQAGRKLERAASAYDRMLPAFSIGAASCYAELADSRFFSDPGNPSAALESAAHVLARAPDSLPGRRLRDSVKQRMIDYYLAGNDEENAKALLIDSGPARVTEEMVLAELGVRYRRLCESLLRRRLAHVLRQSPNDLLEKLQRWIRRALELNADDYLAHYVAADLAFHAGDCDATSDHLKHAIDAGLELAAAKQFLEVAREKRPDCGSLNRLWSALQPAELSHPSESGPR